MSIADLIQQHLQTGELMALHDEETPRCLFYSKEVQTLIEMERWSSKGTAESRALALLQDFVEGCGVTFGFDPDAKGSFAVIAKVHPVHSGFCDFRCINPRPGIRVLGAFTDCDEFVALTWDYRENIDSKWDENVQRCKAEWERLFGRHTPHTSNSINSYVSYNCFPA